jgi:hypothetical protein
MSQPSGHAGRSAVYRFGVNRAVVRNSFCYNDTRSFVLASTNTSYGQDGKFAPIDLIHRFTEAFFTANVVRILLQMRKCKFIYCDMKSTIFRAPFLMKFGEAQHHYVQISYREFDPNRAINAESNT